MRATLALVSFAAVALAQVSQSSDGQPQASSAASVTYTNPFTTFLSQTNSLGVVTGQPSVITSQPTAVTSQPIVVTSPAGTPSGIVVPSVSAPGASSGFSTALSATNGTFSSSSPTATSGSAGPSGSSGATGGSGGSSTSAATTSATTGAAPFVQPAVGLGFAGALFAALL